MIETLIILAIIAPIGSALWLAWYLKGLANPHKVKAGKKLSIEEVSNITNKFHEKSERKSSSFIPSKDQDHVRGGHVVDMFD